MKNVIETILLEKTSRSKKAQLKERAISEAQFTPWDQ